MKALRLQFDPNQKHQHDAVAAVVDLFEGLPRYAVTDAALSTEIVANLPPLVLQEDPQLLMYADNARIKAEG